MSAAPASPFSGSHSHYPPTSPAPTSPYLASHHSPTSAAPTSPCPTSAALGPSFPVPQLPVVPQGDAPGFPIPQTAPAHGPNVPVAIVGSDPRNDAHVLRTPGDSTPRPASKKNVAAPPGRSLRSVFRSLQDHQSPVSGSPDGQGDHENSSKQTPRATL
ncbi:hypothetical protein BC826DRAFT_997528 [Russula brevipes]|nr:hypothetical protein BC826DRAFT_997528 [Russula brevipes]